LHIFNEAASTNSVLDILTITAESSGTPAAGIGAGIVFEIEDGLTVSEEQGRINVELDDVSNGSEDATMTFDINQGGTMTEVMRIDGTAGYVGIGTTSPTAKTHIAGDLASYSGFKLEHTGTGFATLLSITPGYSSGTETQYAVTFDIGGSDASNILLFRENASFMGNITPSNDDSYDLGSTSFRWDDVYATNGTIQTSDRRLKTNIDTLNYGLAEVMQLTPVSFNWKSDTINEIKRNKIGYIAQEVLKIIPEVVNIGDDENQTLGMNYAEMVVVLTKAIQEQQAIIEAQKAEIATEKAENEYQQEEIEAQKQEIETIKAEASTNTTETVQKLAALEAKLNALLLLNSQGAVVTAEN
jgi:hypothetical protein